MNGASHTKFVLAKSLLIIEDIKKICLKEFKQLPEKIVRMAIGICNEVYKIAINKEYYIIRLNKNPETLLGSSKHIPLFKSLGIKVPTIIAQDYSHDTSLYNYQIQTLLKGKDISKVIKHLTEAQLIAIAQEIVIIIKTLSTLPTNGMYGYINSSEANLKANWYDILCTMLQEIKKRNEQTNIVSVRYIIIFKKILETYAYYFAHVPSVFYFPDIDSKNVMIYRNKFNGLVDLDTIAYGDYLESIGRIKTSWYGTKYGEIYTSAILQDLNVTAKQRKIVTIYALLNRIYWLSEIGIQFNQNTSREINEQKVKKAIRIIDSLLQELNINFL